MEDFSKSNNIVYRLFFANNNQLKEWNKNGFIHKTVWHGEESSNSFSLKDKNTYRNEIQHILISRFGIKDIDLFKTKYTEAISGDGQEWTRITTLHSSSLIALLCFYSISKDNPVKINGYTFDESYFEVKTQVYQDSESNMDVVLRGKDECGQKVVLFLECKFSEYISTGQYKGISKTAYKVKYENLGLINGSSTIDNVTIDEVEDGLVILPKDKKQIYCGGIKQMLSHYIGVSNYCSNRNGALAEHQRFVADPNERVLLGEVLFDFGPDITGQKFENYKNAYTSLARIINEKEGKDGIEMLKEVLTYQDIFVIKNSDVIKEENIKKFYNLQK